MAQYKKKIKKEFEKINQFGEMSDGQIGAEGSAYWTWIFSIGRGVEPIEANPDQMPEGANVWNSNDPRLEEKKELAHFLLAKLKLLSPREKEVIELLCKGLSESQTGSLLGISRGAVKDYKNRARTKLLKLLPKVR